MRLYLLRVSFSHTFNPQMREVLRSFVHRVNYFSTKGRLIFFFIVIIEAIILRYPFTLSVSHLFNHFPIFLMRSCDRTQERD